MLPQGILFNLDAQPKTFCGMIYGDVYRVCRQRREIVSHLMFFCVMLFPSSTYRIPTVLSSAGFAAYQQIDACPAGPNLPCDAMPIHIWRKTIITDMTSDEQRTPGEY